MAALAAEGRNAEQELRDLEENFAVPELEWVCCETPGCGKWRVLPEKVKAASLPDSFNCEMNSWDEKKIRKLGCNAPEETQGEAFARLKKDAIRKKKKALAEAARKAERKRLASLGGENASAALATQIPTLATQGSSTTQASGGAGKSGESGGNKAATATKSRKRPVPQGLANAMPVALSGTSYMPLWYDACGIKPCVTDIYLPV